MALSVGSPLRINLLLLSLSTTHAFAGVTNRAGWTEVSSPLAHDRVHVRRLDEAPNPYTCDDGVKSTDGTWKVFGTNIGGWLVLEPWITPSLFYQFMSSDVKWGADAPDHTGFDSKTFCTALGVTEANRQLRRHWRTWVREEDIRAIAEAGSNAVRVPVGDWMYVPYAPYSDGCWDGALEELDRLLALCGKYGLQVLLDVHAMKGSQNGFDNSGEAMKVKWSPVTSQGPDAFTAFEHWSLRAANWVGEFNVDKLSYDEINKANLNHSLRVIERIVERHKADTIVWGIEPVNEPWQFIPIETIKQFYWVAYQRVRAGAPQWQFIMHDSFRGYPAAWWDFMKGCPNKGMDSHIYQAWNRPARIEAFYDNACKYKDGINTMEDLVDMPLIVGEWSLATDNCAMWLNGFNDNLPGYPKVTCDMVACAAPYMGAEQPGCPPSPDEPLQGPYGTGVSGPEFGQCPIGTAWGTKEDEVMTTLCHKHLDSFNSGHGWFFWNFRTELEPHWSFLEAWRKGWFPRNVSDASNNDVTASCADGAQPLSPTLPIISPLSSALFAFSNAVTASTDSADTTRSGTTPATRQAYGGALVAAALWAVAFGGAAVSARQALGVARRRRRRLEMDAAAWPGAEGGLAVGGLFTRAEDGGYIAMGMQQRHG